METPPTMRVHLWLETPDGLYFGLGRVLLLERIDRHGSLKKAADEMNMSYRAAWGKIKKTEEVMGRPLIEKTAGNRHGYRLTDFGRESMSAFKRWHEEVEAYALERARSLISDEIAAFVLDETPGASGTPGSSGE